MLLITVSSELGNSFRGKLVLPSPYYKLNVVKDITSFFQEIERLKQEIDNARELQEQRDSLTQKLQEVEIRNKDLEGQLSDLEQRLEKSQSEQEAFRSNLKTLLEILDGKIFELTELRDNLAKLLECS